MSQLEQWRDIVGYEGWYQVSNMGRVRRARTGPGTYVGRILRPRVHTGGYYQVSLCKNGKVSNNYIHVLVLKAFVVPCPENYECNHRNGKKQDNRVSNLEWVTHTENINHSYQVLDRTRRGCKGESNPYAKLTDQKVHRMRRLSASGTYTQKQLAEMFGCSRPCVSAVVTRRTWTHI